MGSLEYRILGPLEVLRDDQAVALPRAKQRALVLALLLQPNEAISTDRLIEALWGDDPPPTAATALQGHVSQLRKLLPPDTLVTLAPGYLLRVGPGELDADLFGALRTRAQQAVAAGTPEDAATALDEALGLWRGAPLAELTYDTFARNEISRLEELRAEAIEERIDVDLALGRHAESVAELEALVRAAPFRERRRSLLMLALYRSGRQAESLEVFQEGRRQLVDELGIEPGPALQELQQLILAQDSSLRPPPRRTSRPAAPRETRRTVTVVACALELPSGDPEALRRASDDGLAAVRRITERHGGLVERELPDLALATFGAGAVQEDAPVRAVRAAEELGASLAAHIGVATGEMVVGESGAIGEALLDAQRLARHAESGEVLLDEATRVLVAGATELEPAGDAFRLVELDHSERGTARALDSPIVGRENELRVLETAFRRAVDERAPQLVAVVGQAGVGKSRLVAEFLRRVADGSTVLRGRCLSYGDGITFWPVRELVRAAVGASELESVESVAASLRDLVGEGDELAELVGLLGRSAGGTELALAVRTLVETLARERPVVIVLDDLEHAEPALLDLVDFLAEWTRDVPLTIVCLGRPELLEDRPGWAGGRPGVASVPLEALSAGECATLLENLLGGALESSAAVRFAEAAEGNPLFLEQLVSMLLDDGVLREADDGWELARRLSSVPVPPTMQLLLAARLDRLSAPELAVLECAAIEGAFFHLEPIQLAVAERFPSADVDRALRALVAKGLVRPTASAYRGGDAYRFRHLLIRDAAYGWMPKEERGRLHGRFARWLETNVGDRFVEVEEVLGYHLEQAYRLLAETGKSDPALARAAAERLESAGRRADARGDFAAAAGLLGRADRLHDATGVRVLELLPLRVAALRLSGDVREALAAVADALTATRAAGDRRLEAHALLEECSVRLIGDPSVELDDIAAVVEQVRSVFDELGDELGRARANALVGDLCLFRCRFAEAEEAYERSLADSRRAGDAQGSARAHGRLAQATLLGPKPVPDAIARCERILEEHDADPTARSFALAVLAVLEAMSERVEAGRERIAEARALADELGLRRALALIPGFAGYAELVADEPDRAEQELRAGYAMLVAQGETAVLATTAALLAQALERRGELDETRELIGESETWLGLGDRVSQIYWAQVRARAHAQAGETVRARAAARSAVELAADTDMLAVRGAALLDLAAVLEGDERLATLRSAIALFEEKGDYAEARRANAIM